MKLSLSSVVTWTQHAFVTKPAKDAYAARLVDLDEEDTPTLLAKTQRMTRTRRGIEAST